MAVRHHIIGYEAFFNFIKTLEKNRNNIYVLFSGSKLPNGESWCSDCVQAEPTIEEALQKYGNPDLDFVHVEVGDRPTWKDPNCVFRKDPNIHISVLPSIIKWKQPQRLEGEQCEKLDLLELLFTED